MTVKISQRNFIGAERSARCAMFTQQSTIAMGWRKIDSRISKMRFIVPLLSYLARREERRWACRASRIMRDERGRCKRRAMRPAAQDLEGQDTDGRDISTWGRLHRRHCRVVGGAAKSPELPTQGRQAGAPYPGTGFRRSRLCQH